MGVHRDRLLGTFCAILGLASLVLFLRLATTVTLPVVYGFDEGWNAFHAFAAARGHNPYPPPSSFMYNNYPPLSYYVVGGLGLLFGDDIFAGRFLSLVSFLAATASLALIALRMGCRRLEAGFTALLSATVLMADYSYVGMNDPQMMGHAVQLLALLLLLGPRTHLRLAAAALLFSAGFFIKHLLFILPLAATLWLLVNDRRAGLRLALYGTVFAVAGLVLFQLAFGQSLWSQIHSPRVYLLSKTIAGLLGWLQVSALPLAAASWVLFLFRGDVFLRFAAIYLVVALASGIFLTGGAYTSGNMMFDALMALALLGGVGLNRLKSARPAAAPVYIACHALPLVGLLVFHSVNDSFDRRHWLDREGMARQDTRRDIAFLQARQGPAICTLLALCYWAGKPASVDMGMMQQAILTGRRDGRDLENAIAARRFSVIELTFPIQPRLMAAIGAHYRFHHEDTLGTFWVPR
jgi:hypothetical protein